MSEDYGSSAYVTTHMDQMKRTVGGMYLDTRAGPYNETGGYAFTVNPDVSRSYQDALVLHAAEAITPDCRNDFRAGFRIARERIRI